VRPERRPISGVQGPDDSLPVSSETPQLTSVGGVLKVPTGPGLGVTLDPAFVSRAVPVG